MKQQTLLTTTTNMVYLFASHYLFISLATLLIIILVQLDVMWNDIDYMDGYKDFTTDPNKYPLPQMQQFVDKLHSQGRRYVVMTDPGIKIEPGYDAYDDGIRVRIVYNRLCSSFALQHLPRKYTGQHFY